MLLVVAATEPELRGIADVDGVAALACGVGPIDAAASVARRLAAGDVTAVLHVGIAGCRRGAGIEVGSLVLGATARYCDSASPLVAQHEQPDAGLLARAREALPEAKIVDIGTSADVGGTTAAGVDVEA